MGADDGRAVGLDFVGFVLGFADILVVGFKDEGLFDGLTDVTVTGLSVVGGTTGLIVVGFDDAGFDDGRADGFDTPPQWSAVTPHQP